MGERKLYSTSVRIICLILLALGMMQTAGCVVPLHTSARAGNMWELKQHFAWGANPNAKTLWYRDTPLHFAAAYGRVAAVKFLLEKGADVNLGDEGSAIPLHYAAGHGHTEVMKILLDHGSDVTEKGTGCGTPLQWAARNGQTKAAELLLARGANVNQQGTSERTALIDAASHEHVDMVKLLLSRGADPNIRAAYGRTALYEAAGNNNVEIGRILLAHGADPTAEFNGRPIPHQFLISLRQPATDAEDVHLTPYKPGSLIYHVDHYVEDEATLAKQIGNESFGETLLNMSDWNSNYGKLVTNASLNPPLPSFLRLIIYSRRFAKLVEHGHEGLSEEERLGIAKQLKLDLAQWRSLWDDGQRIRAKVKRLHSVTKRSDELIIPVTLRINATILLAGACSIEESLPLVIESAETLGDDTNWSATGYACDKILSSLDSKTLGAEQQRILDEYHAWKSPQRTKIFEYETVELPSFKSPRRPYERATSLGAALDLTEGTVSIEMPPQYTYHILRQNRGYFDPTGSSEVLRKATEFAKAFCEAKH